MLQYIRMLNLKLALSLGLALVIPLSGLVGGVADGAPQRRAVVPSQPSRKPNPPATIKQAGTPAPAQNNQNAAPPPWKKEFDEGQSIRYNARPVDQNGKYDAAGYKATLAKAEEHLRAALELAKDASPVDRANILFDLAQCVFSAGRYSDARDLFEQTISTRKQGDPRETLEIADCYQNIAMCKSLIGENDTVIDDVRSAYAIFNKFLPDDDQKLDYCAAMLADYAASPAEAVPYRRQRVKIHLKQNAQKYPALIGALMVSLAVDLANSGQLTEAVSVAEEAISYCRKEGERYTPYCNFIQGNIKHWTRQKAGLEPAWDVVYNQRYAGRNPRSKPENPNPPTVSLGNAPAREPARREAPEPSRTAPPAKTDGDDRRYYVNGAEVGKTDYDAVRLSNEACDLIQSHKFAEAKDKLLSALSLNPNLPNAHANLGLAFSKLGVRQGAIEHLARAVELSPNDSAPLSMLASVYQGSGQLSEAISTYKKYLSRFPKEDDVAFVRALINDLEKTLAEQRAIESKLSSRPSDNYYAYITSEGKTRWQKERLPLKIYIADGAGVNGFRNSYEKTLRDAFANWSGQTGNLVSFQFVKSRNGADIECIFTNDFSKVGSPAEGGEAQMIYNKDGMKHCTLVLLTVHATNTLNPTDNEIWVVSLHEIGHTLGLMGHSPNPDDIMFCTVPDTELRRPDLSQRDLATLKQLYAE